MAGWKQLGVKNKWACSECMSEDNWASHKWCYSCGVPRKPGSNKPGSSTTAGDKKDINKLEGDKNNPDSKVDQLAERIKCSQLAKDAIKGFNDDEGFNATWKNLDSQIGDCKKHISESKPFPQHLATMDIKKEERITIIEKQIKQLSDESDTLSIEVQTMKEHKMQPEARQLGLLQRGIGEALTTYALMLTLVDRLAAINAMDDLATMRRSTGEVIQAAAGVAAGASQTAQHAGLHAENEDANNEPKKDDMEMDGGNAAASATPAPSARTCPVTPARKSTHIGTPPSAKRPGDGSPPDGDAMGPFGSRQLKAATSDPYPCKGKDDATNITAGFRKGQEDLVL